MFRVNQSLSNAKFPPLVGASISGILYTWSPPVFYLDPLGGYIPSLVPADTPLANSKNTPPRGYSCQYYNIFSENSDLYSTKCFLFSLKCTKIDRWRLGLRPRPRWGSLQRSLRPPSCDGLGSTFHNTPLGSANTPWTEILDKCLVTTRRGFARCSAMALYSALHHISHQRQHLAKL